MKSHHGVLKKNYSDIVRTLELERENASDKEYVPSEELKGGYIQYDTKENLINRLVSKRFTYKLIDMMLSSIITYDKTIT